MSYTKVVFFWSIGKLRWQLWPLIGRDIFDFFSATAELNSMKLDMKEDLNILYQICVFGLIGKQKWLHWPLIGWDVFTFFSSTTEIQENLTGRKYSTSSTKYVFFRTTGKPGLLPWPLVGWDILDFFFATTEWNATTLDRKQYLNILYQVLFFWTIQRTNMATPESDWLRHCQLFLYNHLTVFNEGWQETRF